MPRSPLGFAPVRVELRIKHTKRLCDKCRYSALDAKATHDLAVALKQQLERMDCVPNDPLGMDPDIAQAIGLTDGTSYTMWDLYLDYWQPFGKLLTDMEAEGFNVDR